MNVKTRLFMSALVSLIFYGAWGYYANSLVTDDSMMLWRSALVQGVYSALVTLVYTYLIEFAFERYGKRFWIVPEFNLSIPGAMFSPLVPSLLQTFLVILVNWINQTPNLAATVAPSIIFSAIYGYVYTFGLHRQHKASTSASGP